MYAQNQPGDVFLSDQNAFAALQRAEADADFPAHLKIRMKIVWELGFDEAADGVDFELGDRSRFAVEHDEGDSAVRAERGGRVAGEVVKVDEDVVLEQGLFYNLIAIAPAAADLESGKKGVEALVAQFLVDLLLVTGTGI